jgi:hypothetical protein
MHLSSEKPFGIRLAVIRQPTVVGAAHRPANSELKPSKSSARVRSAGSKMTSICLWWRAGEKTRHYGFLQERHVADSGGIPAA